MLYVVCTYMAICLVIGFVCITTSHNRELKHEKPNKQGNEDAVKEREKQGNHQREHQDRKKRGKTPEAGRGDSAEHSPQVWGEDTEAVTLFEVEF